MRKLIILLCAVALCLGLCVSVHAANGVSAAQATASVFSDGSCQVNLVITIRLDEAVDKLYFPVPENATAVSLNGSRVSAPRADGVRRIDLSRLVRKITGVVSFSVQYTLHDLIHITEADTQELQLPLLSGFEYAIEQLDFTVTLPGNIEAKPAFSSGYHSAGIEALLNATVEGMTVTGSSLKPLKDRETLMMTLAVPEEMFPRAVIVVRDTSAMAIAMGVCAALALLYWLLALRYFPRRPENTTEPPEGCDAGSLGTILALQGMDMSMTVLCWAQLGYLTIQTTGSRVRLCKHMDMGNERSAAEQRCFQRLFSKDTTVDTRSLHFARLWRSVNKKVTPNRELIRPRTGNPLVLRALATGIGVFGGAGLGLVMGNGAVLQGLLVVLIGALGGFTGWLILDWAADLGLRNKGALVRGLLPAAFWLLWGAFCGQFLFALWMVLGLLMGGLLLRFGGLRTDLGKQTAAQVAGFRRHLRKLDSAAVRQRCEADPDYFFRLIPYAMALGVSKSFVKAFGNLHLGECPYVTGGPGEGMTAQRWCQNLEHMLQNMEYRAKHLPMEQFWKFLRSLRQR